MEVLNLKTGEVVRAVYAMTAAGNMRFWAEGRFYSDKAFDSLYKPTTQMYKIEYTDHRTKEPREIMTQNFVIVEWHIEYQFNHGARCKVYKGAEIIGEVAECEQSATGWKYYLQTNQLNPLSYDNAREKAKN